MQGISPPPGVAPPPGSDGASHWPMGPPHGGGWTPPAPLTVGESPTPQRDLPRVGGAEKSPRLPQKPCWGQSVREGASPCPGERGGRLAEPQPRLPPWHLPQCRAGGLQAPLGHMPKVAGRFVCSRASPGILVLLVLSPEVSSGVGGAAEGA